MRFRKVFINNKQSILNKLLSHREVSSDGCWLYNNEKDKNGYGIMTIEYRKYYVHRLSLYIHNTDFDINDSEQQALHKIECKNKNCWNPDHLYKGNHSDNMRDIKLVNPLDPLFPCGHKREEENSVSNGRGVRCRQCNKERCVEISRKHYEKKKLKLLD